MSIADEIEALYEETLRMLDREAEIELGHIGRQFLDWLEDHLPRMPYEGWRNDFDEFVGKLFRERVIVAEKSYWAWIERLREANEAAEEDARTMGSAEAVRAHMREYFKRPDPPQHPNDKPAPFDPDYPQLRRSGNAIMELYPPAEWADVAHLWLQNYRVPEEIKDAFIGWLAGEEERALGVGHAAEVQAARADAPVSGGGHTQQQPEPSAVGAGDMLQPTPHPGTAKIHGAQSPDDFRREQEAKRRAAELRSAVRKALINSVLARLRKALADDPDYRSFMIRLRWQGTDQARALEAAYLLTRVRTYLAAFDGVVLRGNQSPRNTSKTASTPGDEYRTLRALHEVLRQGFFELGLDRVQFKEDRHLTRAPQSAGSGIEIALRNAHDIAEHTPMKPAIYPTGDEFELALMLPLITKLLRPIATIGGRALLGVLRQASADLLTVGGRTLAEQAGKELAKTISRKSAKEILQHLVDDAVAQLARNPGLAKRVVEDGIYNLGKTAKGFPRAFGAAVEQLVKQEIEKDPLLKGLFLSRIRARNSMGRYVGVPDFFGAQTAQGEIFEITTKAGVRRHMLRWYGDLVDYITYEIPAGLTRFPP